MRKNIKDWKGNGDSIFRNLGSSYHTDHEREKDDFYATDPKAVDYLVETGELDKKRLIWECACGQGHISERLEQHGFKVLSSDLVDRGYIWGYNGIDFLKHPLSKLFEGDIVTNPPYRYAKEFVLKALDLVEDGAKVCMFLKIQFLESAERYRDIFDKFPPKKVYVSVKRLKCALGGVFKGASSAVCYAWFVWEKGYKGDTVVAWINK